MTEASLTPDPYPELTPFSQDWPWSKSLLAGRTILITGAGDGIGKSLAKTAACYGANVILLGRTRSKLDQVFDWITTHTQTDPVIVPADLEQLNEASVVALADQISEHFGTLDGLVHNASVLGARTHVQHYPVDTWRSAMDVNVTAPFLLTRGLFNCLDASQDAGVVFLSSTVGREGRAYWGAYSVSKFAMEGLMQVFADETEHAGKIRVYSVNPGGTRTNMRAQAYPMEDPETVPTLESHMTLLLYLLGGPSHGLTLPQQGAALDARDWQLPEA